LIKLQSGRMLIMDPWFAAFDGDHPSVVDRAAAIGC